MVSGYLFMRSANYLCAQSARSPARAREIGRRGISSNRLEYLKSSVELRSDSVRADDTMPRPEIKNRNSCVHIALLNPRDAIAAETSSANCTAIVLRDSVPQPRRQMTFAMRQSERSSRLRGISLRRDFISCPVVFMGNCKRNVSALLAEIRPLRLEAVRRD